MESEDYYATLGLQADASSARCVLFLGVSCLLCLQRCALLSRNMLCEAPLRAHTYFYFFLACSIKKAYKRLALQHHPDKGGEAKTFQRISEGTVAL